MTRFDYPGAVEYIHSIRRFDHEPTLDRMTELLRRLGNPEKKYKIVHVAGTNGKGSTCAMTASILRNAGYRTGLYISPYLVEFNERIQPDCRPCDKDLLADAAGEVFDAAGDLPVTQFEFITATGLVCFARTGCEFVVLETGIGGRFDATSAVSAPEICALTSISLDHTKLLGSTITAIALEKCGIFRPGSDVVVCPGQSEEAMAVIQRECLRVAAELVAPPYAMYSCSEPSLKGEKLSYRGLQIHIPLIGKHQVQNALTAIEIAFALKKRGFSITNRDIIAGIYKSEFQGRFEILSNHPLFIIDGAHNPDGARVLSEAITTVLSGRKLIAILGVTSDKDTASVVAQIAPHCHTVIATSANNPRALAPEVTATLAAPYCDNVEVAFDCDAALTRAWELAGAEDVILACGSLFIAGEIKGIFLRSTK